ncbi:hypothetical protein MKW94_005893 [Papaver nudicaule]|uniref:RING-type domain-containing protein n=1 Tax=Papaver nudicaule TaxID=74823 RepID=A0AA42B0Z3_PAPNU|nr:hypothetical protein [Papaver nudicaule]
MSFSACYPCMYYKDPIELVVDPRVANPSYGTKVFIEVQVREKRVYRNKSGILLNHLHVSSQSHVEPPSKFLLNWRCFQIDFDDLLAKDVFRRCCDVKALSTMSLSSNKRTAARFLKFFKGRVSSFCNKSAAKITEIKPKFVVIVAHITTVCVYDLGDDREALNSLEVCGKSCIRAENPYGATSLAKGAYLFSQAHGSLAYSNTSTFYHRETCAVCLDEILAGTHDVIVVIACDHAFHSKCVLPWFNKVGTCPVCRRLMKLYVTRKLPLVAHIGPLPP